MVEYISRLESAAPVEEDRDTERLRLLEAGW
jgi:hypothetical protein